LTNTSSTRCALAPPDSSSKTSSQRTSCTPSASPRGDALLAPSITRKLINEIHINRAMAKLHARDRAQLVVLAYESGLVAPRTS
jgi:hypothetical protein